MRFKSPQSPAPSAKAFARSSEALGILGGGGAVRRASPSDATGSRRAQPVEIIEHSRAMTNTPPRTRCNVMPFFPRVC